MPNIHKAVDSITDSRVVTQGIEIGAIWSRKDETSGKDYVNLFTADPEFEPKKL